VYYNRGGTYEELRRINEGQRGSLMSQSGQSNASHYEVRVDPTSGIVIDLQPTPASGSYAVQYVAEWPGFAADGTEWYGPARSDELVVLRAAQKAAFKEENYPVADRLGREYDAMLYKVQTMASWLDMRNPASIRDAGDPLAGGRKPFDYDI
jgi:hypothetical protein